MSIWRVLSDLANTFFLSWYYDISNYKVTELAGLDYQL